MSEEKKAKPLSKSRAWAYVWIGGALEIVWASGFKYEAVPPVLVIISLLVSFDLIIRATKALPVGTTYAVFTAIGTIGTVAVEAVFSGGQITWLKVVLVFLLLLCIVGLKLTSKEGEQH
jgi:paired small multidrug resistance pump